MADYPVPQSPSTAVVSIGPDGRVYFHDLDRELIEVALAINPTDAAMRKRLASCQNQRKTEQKETGRCRKGTHSRSSMS